ncbi:MAG: SMP-30/gluconolactonase/LRE family protein [Propionibacteriales bacterium]|nr:SMP-30/gluconolactonase/LRE family protein [Propionibacteriales bacterium]
MLTSRRPVRAACAAVALIASTVAVLGSQVEAGATTCPAWSKSTVASGYGLLENLAFDGQGSLLLSEGSVGGTPGGLRALSAAGVRSTVVPDVTSPGGIVVDGRTAYFNTGDGLASGFFNLADGTISKVDLDTGEVGTVATGLVMPNGLIRLPNGDFVVSRDLGKGSMTRVTPTGVKSAFAPAATNTNGMAVDAARNKFYVVSTFNLTTEVYVVDLGDPAAAPRTIQVPGLGPLNAADDVTLGTDGNLYVALNVAGSVIRVNPGTGAQCTVAKGLPFSSSLRFGAGPGWDPQSLYVTSFLGTVTRLRP